MCSLIDRVYISVENWNPRATFAFLAAVGHAVPVKQSYRERAKKKKEEVYSQSLLLETNWKEIQEKR